VVIERHSAERDTHLLSLLCAACLSLCESVRLSLLYSLQMVEMNNTKAVLYVTFCVYALSAHKVNKTSSRSLGFIVGVACNSYTVV